MKAHASVIDDVQDDQEDKEYIKFSVDYTWFRFIAPHMTQNTNYFYSPSEAIINDSLFDVFGFYERSYHFFEESMRDSYLSFQRSGSHFPIAEREYI